MERWVEWERNGLHMMSNPPGWGWGRVPETRWGQATDGDHGNSLAEEREGKMSLVIIR